MQNLYYTVKKQLQQIGDVEETTGWKTIILYDIDTQSMNIIQIGEFIALNEKSSEEEIYVFLENNDNENQYNLIQL